METGQVCMPSNYFALFVFVGLAIIAYSLWQVNQQANQLRSLTENQRSRVEAMADNMDDIINQRLKAQASQSDEILRDFVSLQRSQRDLDYQRLRDPLIPPLQSGPLSPIFNGQSIIPINIPTRGEYGPFQQVGYAYKQNRSDMMFPLFGRPIQSGKWEYYCTNPLNNIKIPIRVKGDWELSGDDRIPIEGFGGLFKVNIYDLDQPRYIPY